MIVFWSWQADTPGKIGRHFVRDAISEAIDVLKADQDIVEPSEREARDALELDQDRQGVPGSPDLAATIFRKIDEAAVFVADVTCVGITPDGKKLINSNVAIEYGHAHKSLGDTSILMVQNTHYGSRDDLPFDLRHKAGPIQFTLAPDATKQQIASERAKLRGEFVARLRPYLKMKPMVQRPLHKETPSTYIKAAFAQPGEILARIGRGTPDEIAYRFDEMRAFYLRLIPYYDRTTPLSHADLADLAVHKRAIDIPARQIYSGYGDRNHFGAIVFEPHGTAEVPRALTQAFRNGELWALTTEFFVHWRGYDLIPAPNVYNILLRVLENFVSLSENQFANGRPITIVLGAVGLAGYSFSKSRDHIELVGPIHQNELELRITLDDPSAEAQERHVDQFLRELYDVAGVRLNEAVPWK
jgi:hypothetical protein